MVKKAEITKKIIKIIVSLIGKVLLAFVLFLRCWQLAQQTGFLRPLGQWIFP